MYLFIMGRQPEIGATELCATFGDNIEPFLPNVMLVSAKTTPEIDRLGGTRKVGRIIFDGDIKTNIEKILCDKLDTLPSGKITLGISRYGQNADPKTAMQTALRVKKTLGRSMRILPNSQAEISDAATLGNGLGRSPHKVEFMIADNGRRLLIAELTGVQDLNAYTRRDRGRPRRDARNGMLPPKLAQIMINLATNGQTDGVILDPFCGTGVVLQEASLAGFDVFGTDVEPRMVDFTTQNLEWLRQTHHVDFHQELEVGDATDFRWHAPIDFVVSEVYLGQPYSTSPPPEKLHENIKTCKIIVEKFLANITPQLESGTRLCLAIPAWFTHSKPHYLSPEIPTELSIIQPQNPCFRGLTRKCVYRREGQIVGRELIVLQKK